MFIRTFRRLTFDYFFGSGGIYLLLGRVGLEDPIEHVAFAADDAGVLLLLIGEFDHYFTAALLLAFIERPESAHYSYIAFVRHYIFIFE